MTPDEVQEQSDVSSADKARRRPVQLALTSFLDACLPQCGTFGQVHLNNLMNEVSLEVSTPCSFRTRLTLFLQI